MIKQLMENMNNLKQQLGYSNESIGFRINEDFQKKKKICRTFHKEHKSRLFQQCILV